MKKRKAYAIIACILACILISGCGSKEKEAKWQEIGRASCRERVLRLV